MTHLQITAAAEAELREATAWYRERDVRVAQRFTAEVRRTLELIESFPQIGGRVPGVADGDVRRLPVHTFPYHLIFLALIDHVEVIGLAHNRRRPAYFMSR